MIASLTIKRLKLTKLIPHPKNPRHHPEPGTPKWIALKKSLESSYFDPIVINTGGIDPTLKNVLVSGHLRTKVLIASGFKEADCVVVNFDSPTHIARMMAANQLAGDDDEAAMATLLQGLDQSMIDLTGIDAETFKLLTAPEPTDVDAEPQMDRAAELAKKWGVERGQVWQLGEHRLMCEDSTDAASVGALMGSELATLVFTDPPYGVAIGVKNRMLNSFQPSGRNLTDIVSDEMSAKELKEMLLACFTLSKTIMADDCAVFVCSPQGGELRMMMMMMMEAGLEIRHVLNWIKNSPTFSMGRLDYDYQHEPILFTWKKNHKRFGNGQFQTSIWSVDKPRKSPEHPTMKPVELPVNAILNHTESGDICYEPFSGSGTMLIACEQTARRCRAMEISPGYVAVAIQRWCDATGKTPIKL